MKSSIHKRLQDLEALYGIEAVLLVSVDGTTNGEHTEMTVREYAEHPTALFLKVISGGTLKDADIILDKHLGDNKI